MTSKMRVVISSFSFPLICQQNNQQNSRTVMEQLRCVVAKIEVFIFSKVDVFNTVFI